MTSELFIFLSKGGWGNGLVGVGLCCLMVDILVGRAGDRRHF